jgi:hypothetical protein
MRRLYDESATTRSHRPNSTSATMPAMTATSACLPAGASRLRMICLPLKAKKATNTSTTGEMPGFSSQSLILMAPNSLRR